MSASGASLTEQEISAYNQSVAQARAQQAEQEAKLHTATSQLARGSNGEDVGAALDSPVIQQLRAQRSQASAKLADLSSRYGPRHPDDRCQPWPGITVSLRRPPPLDTPMPVTSDDHAVEASLEGEVVARAELTDADPVPVEPVDAEVARSGFSGVVRVDRAGGTELVRAYGFADRAHGIANTVDTQFATASGTKGFTALAVMALVESGTLELSTTARPGGVSTTLGRDLPSAVESGPRLHEDMVCCSAGFGCGVSDPLSVR